MYDRIMVYSTELVMCVSNHATCTPDDYLPIRIKYWRPYDSGALMYILRICIFLFFLQKHEESSSNNGPVSIADVQNETIVQLVDDGVAAIMTRLQSEW